MAQWMTIEYNYDLSNGYHRQPTVSVFCFNQLNTWVYACIKNKKNWCKDPCVSF